MKNEEEAVPLLHCFVHQYINDVADRKIIKRVSNTSTGITSIY